MRDIETREDIEKIMKAFYERAIRDETIGYLFTDIARLDLEAHLPIIVDFWEMVLFNTINFQAKYGRSPMQKHLELNEKEQLQKPHFETWLRLFDQTIEENFQGKKADLAKYRAKAIGNTIFLKASSKNRGAIPVFPG